MDKNALDYSKLPLNPYSPNFRKWVTDNIPKMMERDLSSVGQSETLRYIYLMYHDQSPIHNIVGIDWFGKKFEAAEAAGFTQKKDKQGLMRFTPEVNECLLGKNEQFNDAIIDFVGWLSNPVWTEMIWLHETMMKYLKESLGGGTGDNKSVKTVQDIYDRLGVLSKRLTMNEQDSDDLLRRIYHRIEESRLAIRPEDYARRILEGDRLHEDSPYGAQYPEPEEITFYGLKIPQRASKNRNRK